MNSPEMPFTEHLRDLRVCLIRATIAIIIAAVLSFTWATELFNLITGPIRENFTNVQLIGTGPAEAFVIKLKVSIVFGILITAPWSFWQLWLFVAPGLHDHERKLAFPFVFWSTLFFLCGVSFCFYLVLPFAFSFFAAEFASIGVNPQIKINEYLSFCLWLLLVFGIMFELPVLSFVLAKLRLLSSSFLKRNFRYSIVAIFIIAAILTPPDVVTQTLLALPLLVLYGLCILVTQSVENKSSSALKPTNLSSN